ncbi:MAG: glutamine-hydrolyzing carbamoyl-phosphate synthase small subunit [Legionellales bacterium]|nr:glutamine-hydrolyzing carbamoyl-phosphate synthase small subunit [Legionellales bacterium]
MQQEILSPTPKAVLALADGNIFHGIAVGYLGEAQGEVVFNTAMTGYQEILSDPSYAAQLVTLTYPHIGNVGTNHYDNEASTIYCQGLIIRDLSRVVSNWRSETTLPEFLQQHKIVAIAEIDTRRLTRLLRDQGAQNGIILCGDNFDEASAIQKAQQIPSLSGQNLANVVSTTAIYEWREGIWHYPVGYRTRPDHELVHHVVVYDFGVKKNILRLLVEHGCFLTVVPATTSIDTVLALKPDGVMLSNGPGDPAACEQAIANTQQLIKARIPVLGICLGFQILALALGAKTYKMKFGHHGANHPVRNEITGKVAITAQNHGFAVDEASLPQTITITHRSLFDGTVQGFASNTLPIMGFQGHPEASPGPHDLNELFAEFVNQLVD